MISTIVLDFDGTLVDSNAVKRQGFFDVVAGHAGGPTRMGQVLERVRGDRRAIFAAYVADVAGNNAASAEEIEALVQAYSERVDSSVAAAREMPGATRLLQQLHERGRSLYLSSATPISSLRWVVSQRGWREFFTDVFGYPASKRDSIERIREMAGGDSASLVVVGDGMDDRDSAAWIGCRFFAVGEARGAPATERVFTLIELLDIFLDRAEIPGQ